jgi:molybdopterin converting factor small subunit
MSRILLLGPAREAAGLRDDVIDGENLGDVLDAAVRRYGPAFSEVLSVSKVWVNGEPSTPEQRVGPQDEVVVLPPISGG